MSSSSASFVTVSVVVLTVVSAFILLLANNEQAKQMLRTTQLVFDSDNMATMDTFAPIFMQQEATGTHPIRLFLQKYGFTGTKKSGRSAPFIAVSKTSSGDPTRSWVVASISGNSPDASAEACEGHEYFNAGVMLDTCIDMDDSSIILTCSNGDITAYEYSGNSCSGSASSSDVLANEGCSLDPSTTPWGQLATDDDYGRSISYSCVTATDSGPDVGESPNHYAVLKSYTEGSCSASSYVYFESYNGDVCIPLTISIKGEQEEDASVMFKDGQYSEVGGTAAPYMKIYGANRKCVGAQTTKVLSTQCASDEQWDFIYYDESATKTSSDKGKGKGKA